MQGRCQALTYPPGRELNKPCSRPTQTLCDPMAAGRLAGLQARPLGAAEPLALGSLLGRVLLVSNVASL